MPGISDIGLLARKISNKPIFLARIYVINVEPSRAEVAASMRW